VVPEGSATKDSIVKAEDEDAIALMRAALEVKLGRPHILFRCRP